MAEVQQETNLANLLSDLNARVRIPEEKYNLFGERLILINQNMVDEYKKITRQVKTQDAETKELKKEIFHLKEIIKELVKEMSNFAKKDSLKILEKYINLWNPLHFVTSNEVEKMIDKKLEEKREDTKKHTLPYDPKSKIEYV